MKNAIRLMTAAALTVLMSLGFAGSSQAYPDKPGITIEIDGDILVGGNTFDYTATADFSNTTSDSDCNWTVTYGPAVNGPTSQTGTGTSLSGTFDTPPVPSRTDTTITATCEYDAPEALGSGTDVQSAATSSASAVVTLLPLGDDGGDNNAGNDSNGFLPNSGGAALWILILGAALVVAGGGAYAMSRRSSH